MKNYFKYNKYLLKEGKSEKTINLYLYYLNKFNEWYENTTDKTFEKLSSGLVEDYIKSISNKLRISSINSVINFLRSYNKFLVEEKIQKDIVVDKNLRIISQNEKAVKHKIIDERFMESLLQNIYAKDGIKNHTILFILAYSGLRAIEVTELKIQDIDFIARSINVSGRYQRKVPMDSKVENCLKLYFRELDYTQKYLFQNEKDNQFTERGIQWIFRKNCPDSSITLSMLRAFYKNKLVSQGYNNKERDELLGYTTKGKNYSSLELKNMLVPRQVAEIFNVTPLTIINWCDRGIIRAFKTEKGFRKIPYSEVERLKEEKDKVKN